MRPWRKIKKGEADRLWQGWGKGDFYFKRWSENASLRKLYLIRAALTKPEGKNRQEAEGRESAKALRSEYVWCIWRAVRRKSTWLEQKGGEERHLVRRLERWQEPNRVRSSHLLRQTFLEGVTWSGLGFIIIPLAAGWRTDCSPREVGEGRETSKEAMAIFSVRDDTPRTRVVTVGLMGSSQIPHIIKKVQLSSFTEGMDMEYKRSRRVTDNSNMLAWGTGQMQVPFAKLENHKQDQGNDRH